MPEQTHTNRGPWIIAGSLVAAAAIVAVALVLTNQPDPRAGDGSNEAPILPESAMETFVAIRARAQDRAAQSDLRNALTAAKYYWTQDETYAGFNAAVGASIEPGLTWMDDSPATEGVVSVNDSDDSSVVLSTLSASGQPFCIGDDSGGTYYGTTDAYAETCDASGWGPE